METDTLYNFEGKAIAYIFEGEYIYLYDGTPAAFLHNEYVYAFSGQYLGWIQDGWVIDVEGNRVFFTENATGGPVRPVRHVRPVRGVRKVRPVRGVREVCPPRPVRSLAWSHKSDESFFDD